MSSTIVSLQAEARDNAGRGASREIRRSGRVPGIIYGGNEENVMFSMDIRDVVREYHKVTFASTLFEINVGGKKELALVKDLQIHPVTDSPIHIDFLRVGKDSEVAVFVPVRFINDEKSPGLKAGGILNVVRHEVELNCPATSIPDEIVVDLGALAAGETIHWEDDAVTRPEGAAPAIERNFTIASCAAPGGGAAADDEGAEDEGEAEE